MPSPTIPTFLRELPFATLCSSFTLSAFCPGGTSANTVSIPNSRAMRSAVARLSPVSIATWMPRSCNFATAALEVSRGASAIAINPAILPSTAAYTTVRPAPSSESAGCSSPLKLMLLSRMSLRLPTSSVLPSTFARNPWPGIASNSCGGTSARFSAFALFTIACPRACSEDCSTEATSASKSFVIRRSSFVTMSVTSGCPRVSVPVLSKIIAPTWEVSSSAVAFLNKMPFCAPSPVPIITAVGVARPSASGHAMTTTVIAMVNAQTNGVTSGGTKLRPSVNQPSSVNVPIIIAAATSHCAARSASRCAGAFEFCAACTNFTICASAVSAPTLVALNWKVPVLLIVAPVTMSPVFFERGRDSPVIMDSSTSELPSVTTPSTGILLPGRINTMSFNSTSAVGISNSCPSRITVAMGGARLSNA